MFTFNLAYRYSTGEVEGFTGTAFTEERAEQDALRKLRDKITTIQHSRPDEPDFDESQLLTEATTTADEMEQLRKDWEVSARSSQV